ncbi:MAG: peptidylprolyl isomerase [candidate division Zixibacteria bacterium]|nr:peptidylprolyl isomerase [candidate division Zixibacteria bacterium]
MKRSSIIAILTIVAMALLAGCSGEPVAKSGDTVKVKYRVSLEDGTVVDSSATDDPLEFTLGSGQIIPGVENAVIGMKIGDADTVIVIPEEAYGPYRQEMIGQINRGEFPADMELVVGGQLSMPQPNGGFIPVTIVAVDDTMVTLDANHPLAGKTLTFALELKEIVAPVP